MEKQITVKVALSTPMETFQRLRQMTNNWFWFWDDQARQCTGSSECVYKLVDFRKEWFMGNWILHITYALISFKEKIKSHKEQAWRDLQLR